MFVVELLTESKKKITAIKANLNSIATEMDNQRNQLNSIKSSLEILQEVPIESRNDHYHCMVKDLTDQYNDHRQRYELTVGELHTRLERMLETFEPSE